ncbi:hypothetical protein NDU88_007140 [Pleurodeles waltl]|uniref:Uncharacterized protein n=1 Tax=Pleurodeles waltl TaxID=8319 RepID=A0AAV7U0B3_PLEWA|nr:hypothetical protein NDU88_007140 [Pleurodeles waltl]
MAQSIGRGQRQPAHTTFTRAQPLSGQDCCSRADPDHPPTSYGKGPHHVAGSRGSSRPSCSAGRGATAAPSGHQWHSDRAPPGTTASQLPGAQAQAVTSSVFKSLACPPFCLHPPFGSRRVSTPPLSVGQGDASSQLAARPMSRQDRLSHSCEAMYTVDDGG